MICSNCCEEESTGVVAWENVSFVVCDACALFYAQWKQANQPDDEAG